MHYAQMKVVIPSWYLERGHKLVGLKVEPFDAAWSKEADVYVGLNGLTKEGRTAHRYIGFKNWLTRRDPTEDHVIAAVVGVYEDGRVCFENGRQRFAFLRDHGVKIMPVAMETGQIENARRYGYLHLVYTTRSRT